MERLISLFGLLVMVSLAWLMSSNKRIVNWRIIIGGLLLQFVLGVFVLWTPPGRWLFDSIGSAFGQLQDAVDQGAGFVFGDFAAKTKIAEGKDIPLESPFNTFAFRVLPTIIVFGAIMSVLYYIGLMQMIVNAMAQVMQWTLGTSGAESLSAAANVFVGHTEAPLVIRPYLSGMTLSELNAVMVGGFATISGGLLAAYSGMGIHPGHLVTASVISAPAALLIAKIMQPETDVSQTFGHVTAKIPKRGANLIESVVIGATDGMKLAVNVGTMLIAFLALIAIANAIVGWIGTWFGSTWSLEGGLGYLFAPLAWLMGIESGECREAGQLLGLKMVANEFIAYQRLGEWIDDGSQVQISKRTQYILTYALSGFSNFGAVGIQIGGIGGLAPDRRSDLAKLGIRAMLGGTLACCMTACVAGVLIR